MKNFNYDHFPSGKWRKALFIMRLKLLIILCTAGTLTASPTFSQQQKLDATYRNASLVTVLDDIKAQTGVHFFYFDGIVPANITVSVDLKGATLEQVLNEVLVKNGFTYEIGDAGIAIGRARQQPQQPQRPSTTTVRGKVQDADGRPIAGATVLVKGLTIGTATDGNGEFSLRVQPGENTVLTFSFIGKQAVEISYTGQETMTVTLMDDVAEIEQVIVTGIFDRPRESYTGSVTTISEQELKVFRGQNILQTLANIDPAINIVQDNVVGSNPNVLPQINIRGNSTLPMSVSDFNQSEEKTLNTPLVILDGFEITLERLMDYNDDDIKSINILKDASATAIYGSRGANGVIVIVTKAPQPGQLRVNFTAGLDFEIPDLSTYDLLNARELFELQDALGLYYSPNDNMYNYLTESYTARKRDILEGADTDWLHYPVRTGLSQRYSARVDGGSQEFRWAASLGYNKEAGAMKGSDRNNFNGGITLSYTYKNLVFRNDLSIGVNRSKESPYGSFQTYVDMPPYYMPYDKDGALVEAFDPFHLVGSPSVANPLWDAKQNTRNESSYTQLINNFSIEWKVVDGFYIRGRFGISKKDSESDEFYPPDHSMFRTGYESDEDFFRRGRYNYGTGKSLSYDGNLTFNYSKLFNDKHLLYTGLDLSIKENTGRRYAIELEGFSDNKSDFFGTAGQYYEYGTPYGTESTTRTVGLTANVNYTYDSRYYVDASYRLDGSSQFGADSRFAPFWSVGAGWSIHNEEFLRNNRTISNLRFKVSYGLSGSQNFNAYDAQATYRYLLSDKYLGVSGAELIGIGNETLRWQNTYQFNAGMEVTLLRNRYGMTFDYYVKTTKGLISSMQLPLSTGYSSFIDNIGEVRNRGFEVSANAIIISNPNSWTWSVGARMAYNKNEIIKLSEDIKAQTEAYRASNAEIGTLYYEGYSPNSLWAVRSLGIDPSTGNELFLDEDGLVTTVYNPAAKVYCGVSEPSFRGNVTTMLRYKNLSLNLSFGYHWGGQQENSTLRNKVEVTAATLRTNNVDRRVYTERWLNPGDLKAFKGFTDESTRATSRFIMDDNVFHLQSASLQYRLYDSEFLKKLNMQSLTISANISDLFYISSIKRERGTDYPFARSAGLSLSFQF